MNRAALQALWRRRPQGPFGFWGARPEAGPDHPIRIGLGEAGTDGPASLAAFLQDRRVRVVAVCEPDEDARRRLARSAALPLCASFEEMAGSASVEAVHLGAADPRLVERVEMAARHGKHVMVERPVALSVDDCDRMIAACREAGVQLLIGGVHSFDLPCLQARELIEAGEVGRVRMIHAFHYAAGPGCEVPPGGARPAALAAAAIHQVELVRLLAGGEVRRVRAEAAADGAAYTAFLRFDDGALATLVYSGGGRFDSSPWCGSTDETGRAAGDFSDAAAVCLQDGGFVRPRQHPHFGPVIVSGERGDLRPMPDAVWVYGAAHSERRALRSPGPPQAGLVDELQRAIRSGRPPLHDGAWTRATLQVCEALRESARRRSDVEL